MEKFVVTGGNVLQGTVSVSGAKNVALKALVAASLTEEPVIIENVPLISDFFVMVEIIKHLGGTVTLEDHTAHIQVERFQKVDISLDEASHIRTSSMFIAPLLARNGQAVIPNPGGCRLGARPIDRTVDGLAALGVEISYSSDDGNFYAQTEQLKGTHYRFEKNTHTGTETLLIAAVLAEGQTILENAAAEPEIDELIALLNSMGARIQRTEMRTIVIDGVKKLHGTTFRIQPDRNEIVTFAVAALVTKGDVFIKEAKREALKEFIEKLEEAGAGIEEKEEGIRFYYKGELKAVDVETQPYPGFMTDWQSPWAVLMTQARGEAVVHETVFENKFGYVKDLKKMGAKIDRFNPPVEDKAAFYNFNLSDDKPEYFHAIRIKGPTQLHNAVMTMLDLRAGAAVVIAALAAKGESVIHGLHLVDRGYENFGVRLAALGATIKRVKEDE